MASKKEIFASAMELCKANGASEKLVKGLTELLEPKKGGATVNIEDVFVPKAKDGKAYLLCSVSDLWMEATADNFYEDASENNKFGGVKRLSRAAEGARKKAVAAKKATEKAVMADLIAKKITPEQGEAELAKVKAPDFSGIEGSKTKPAV